ncbi:MAG: hypothetical protein WA655_22575 [Candidatus Korobacteraceae bacterium]
MHRLSLLVTSLLLFVVTGCGGGNSSNTPAALTIQLSPAAPSVPVNASIAIDAQTSPSLPKYTGTLTWSIQGYSSPTDCTEVMGNPESAPPISGCPRGWLAWGPSLTGYTPLGVYYYAPDTPGNYQVVVQGQILDQTISQKIEYQGSATATVTVTAQ